MGPVTAHDRRSIAIDAAADERSAILARVTISLEHALSAHRSGDFARAEHVYLELLAQAPHEPNALHMLGLLRHQQQRSAEAAPLIERAIHAGAVGAAVYANLAAVRLALGEHAAAVASAHHALAIDPAHFGALLNLGLAREGQGDWPAARAALERAHAQRPFDPVASEALARVLERLEAWPALRALWQQALAAAPGAARPAFDLGRLALQEGRLLDGVAHLRAALAGDAPPRDTRLLLASGLLELGEIEESLAVSAALLREHPDYREAHSNALIAMQHDADVGAEALYAAHRGWAQRHLPPAPPAKHAHAHDAQRPLVLGFVSPRLHAGPVATFLAPVLEALDRARHRVILYAASSYADAATTRLRSLAGAWRDAWRFDDETLCAAIRDDAVDVLFDLSGHAPANRLAVFARRPAPVQVAWLDYFCTTGLDAIDWYYTDPVLTPEPSAQRFAERPLRLPRGRLCYAPPADAPPVAAREGAASIRFASFNRLAKLDAGVAAAWSAVLRRVPGSVLRLKASGLDDPATAEWVYRHRFAAHGVARERLELEGFGSYGDTLARYADVDVALDPFPFSGCATSCDALWMGVPVVTRAGGTLVSRQTASLLHAVALEDLVRDSWPAYVETAVALAEDGARRRALRADLRARAQRGFADAAAFTAAFEDAVRGCWRAWCER